MAQSTSVKFLRKQQLAPNTFAFFFEKKFSKFLPGQFTTLFVGKDSRDFTVASTHFDKDLMIVTKEGKSDFKKKLFHLLPGEKVHMTAPSGGYTLPEDTATSHIFLAGGIGITPFYSMMTYAHKKNFQMPLTLFVSFSKKENIIFQEELQTISAKNNKTKTIYSLERISEKLLRKHVKNIKKVKYMIAGSEQMVYSTEELLLQMGIPSENIRIDIFTGYL